MCSGIVDVQTFVLWFWLQNMREQKQPFTQFDVDGLFMCKTVVISLGPATRVHAHLQHSGALYCVVAVSAGDIGETRGARAACKTRPSRASQCHGFQGCSFPLNRLPQVPKRGVHSPSVGRRGGTHLLTTLHLPVSTGYQP